MDEKNIIVVQFVLKYKKYGWYIGADRASAVGIRDRDHLHSRVEESEFRFRDKWIFIRSVP